jgi:hypothetical protein
MSKRKRDDKGQYAKHHSTKFIAFVWLSSFLSLGLLYLSARVLAADFASFRSCSSNSSLAIHNCGKGSLNFGDIGLVLLFILSATMVVSLFTAAWRLTRNRTTK